MKGMVIKYERDNIDTDVILPGTYLKIHDYDELATHEKCLLLGALKKTNGVQKKAAELLGINYRSFRHRLEKYGLLSIKNHGILFRGGILILCLY